VATEKSLGPMGAEGFGSPPSATRSTLGAQLSSKRVSAPDYGFGTGTREVANKLFISEAHAKLSQSPKDASGSPSPVSYPQQAAVGPQTNSRKAAAASWVFGTQDRFSAVGFGAPNHAKAAVPGPGRYESTSSVGGQMDSRYGTQPSIGFGSSERHHLKNMFISNEHAKRSAYGRASVNCGMYVPSGAFNKQELSKQSNAPSWVFGTGGRLKPQDPLHRAGPGSYEAASAVGQQQLSTRTSAAVYGFGSTERDANSKVYISQEHETGNLGLHSPSPGQYHLRSSIGIQATSKKMNAPSWRFGSSNRWELNMQQTVGPGSYVV